MLQGDRNTTLGTDKGCRVLGPSEEGGGIALVVNWDPLRHSVCLPFLYLSFVLPAPEACFRFGWVSLGS